MCYDVDTMICILEHYFPNRVINSYYSCIIRNNNIHQVSQAYVND